MEHFIILALIGVIIVCSAVRGAMSDIRYFGGIIFGIAAIPLLYKPVSMLIESTGLIQAMVTGLPAAVPSFLTGYFMQYMLKAITFVVIGYIARKILYDLIPAGHQLKGVLRAVDVAAGGVLGVCKVCILIWAIDLCLGIVAGYLPQISQFKAMLDADSLYSFIKNFNLFKL